MRSPVPRSGSKRPSRPSGTRRIEPGRRLLRPSFAAAAVLALSLCLLLPSGAAAGKLIASSGFNPARNGFPFANYGAGRTNLSVKGMRAIFGNVVCNSPTAPTCTLTPPAQRFQMEANRAMEGGHCFGFAVLSLLLYRHRFPALARPAIRRLRLRGNNFLQETIAYAFSWQFLPALQETWVKGTPNEELATLISSLQHKGSELYAMAIYLPGFMGGHAITPYAVEELGGGKYDVLVYDNNWPREVRRMRFDTNKDTWSYNAAINPKEPGALYTGDASTGTLSLVPIAPLLGVHHCPFCLEANSAATTYNELHLEGGNPYNHGHMLIRNLQGQAIGFTPNGFVSEMPGAKAVFPTSAVAPWRQQPTPVYQIPPSTKYLNILLDGSGLAFPNREHFSLIGTNHYLAIDAFELLPHEHDTLILNSETQSLAYTSESSQAESPFFTVGLVTKPGNYTIAVRPKDITAGTTVTITDRVAKQELAVQDSSPAPRTYEVTIKNAGAGGEQTLSDVLVEKPAGKTLDILYGAPDSSGSRYELE